jgi:hypothetical protein
MDLSENLFIRLHHWASRQDENFTAEAFIYLLKHLQGSEENSFLNIISNLSGNLIIPSIDKAHEIKISSQIHIDNSVPDIQIETPSKLIFVEVKFASKLERKQVSTYLELLKNSPYIPENTRLVCLTRSPISSDITDGALPVRWYQVAEWLENELTSIGNENSKFLILTFIDFLTFQKAILTKVSSPISEGLSKYKNIAGEDSILYKRFKSLDKLLSADELKPLHDFMLLLFEALKTIVDESKIKFDSGNDRSGDGFVTYNINNGEYFVWLKYNRPETLIFTTYNRVIEKEQDSLKLGKIVFEYKRVRWKNEVDLSNGFIDLIKQDQLNLLIEVAKNNLSFAESISQPWPKKS